MNAKKFIWLKGFIILVFGLVVLALFFLSAVAVADRNDTQLPVSKSIAVPVPIHAAPQMTPVPKRPKAELIIIPSQAVPTPEKELAAAEILPARQSDGINLSPILFIISLGLLTVWGVGRWITPDRQLMGKHAVGQVMTLLLGLLLLGCQPQAADPLPPDQYLDNALSWLETNAVTAESVDWDEVRAEAESLASNPQTTADTYPAIRYAQRQLNDYLAFLHLPEQNVWEREAIGLTAVFPQNVIVEIEPGSPAAEARIEVGDQVLAVNGFPPKPSEERPRHVDFQFDKEDPAPVTLSLQRGGEKWDLTLMREDYENIGRPISQSFVLEGKTVAYLDLVTDVGTRMYPTYAQAAIADVDSPGTCGWIIDLRRNKGGDLWTYFAALSPILGEGDLGGFLYTDGSQETWALRDGKVFWADEEREESYVRGPLYQIERRSPPVALLISPLTEAAGELIVAAFQGWGTVRTFGEATLGAPHLVLSTPLSDGALLFVSGARGMDRKGNVYHGPITPDEMVSIDWQHLRDNEDPVISSALEWLAEQPACKTSS